MWFLSITAFAPNTPTLVEQGLKGFVYDEWFGFYVPAKTPTDVISRLNAAMRAALAAPETVNGLALMGLVAQSSTPAELATRLKSDTDLWAPLIKSIGFSADA